MSIQSIKKKMLFYFFLIFALPVYAEKDLLIINEIYPNPDANSSQPFEWVEIINISSSIISSSQILITDASGKKLNLTTDPIYPNQYAVATSSSILNNSGDTVKIILASTSAILNEVSYSNTNKGISWARCPDKTGQIAKTNDQTPGSANLCPTSTPTPTPTLTPTPPTPRDIQEKVLDQLEISEVYPAPLSGEKEWVEIFNPYDYEVLLEDYFIDDSPEGSSAISFTITVPARSYTSIELPRSILNNSGDQARLLSPEGKEISILSFGKTQKGTSWIKDPEGRICQSQPSRDRPNPACRNPQKNSQTAPINDKNLNKPSTSTKSKKTKPQQPNLYTAKLPLKTADENTKILGASATNTSTKKQEDNTSLLFFNNILVLLAYPLAKLLIQRP